MPHKIPEFRLLPLSTYAQIIFNFISHWACFQTFDLVLFTDQSSLYLPSLQIPLIRWEISPSNLLRQTARNGLSQLVFSSTTNSCPRPLDKPYPPLTLRESISPSGLIQTTPSSRKEQHTNGTLLLRTEEEIAAVHAATADDVDKAVKAAAAALKNPAWKELASSDRGILMARLADLIDSNKELLATIDAWDNGEKTPKSPLYVWHVHNNPTLTAFSLQVKLTQRR